MLQQAHQYIVAETLVAGKRDESKRPRGHPSGPPKRREDRSDMLPSRPPPVPLNSTRTEIFLQIRERGLLKTLNPMKTRSERRDKRRYCRFHREHGHDTEECRDLQSQIDDLIQHGHLCRYVRDQLRSPIVGPLETRRPGQRGRPRAATAPQRARLMHALRLERGLRTKKTSTSSSGRGTKIPDSSGGERSQE
ncbi:hypothetical protein BHE74_00039234 [Ensete ventricosum]|nr:hypothetical protein BHE74_00039234 [Ensete ventricosum]